MIFHLQFFRSSAGDDFITLRSDLSPGPRGRLETSDPAAWFDWQEAILKSRGFIISDLLKSGENVVRVLGHSAFRVKLATGRNPMWMDLPPERQRSTSRRLSELSALELVRTILDGAAQVEPMSVSLILGWLDSETPVTRIPGWEHGERLAEAFERSLNNHDASDH
jgi:hypothetical protein